MRDLLGPLHPKNDPTRRCLKLENWPEKDRMAWQAATTKGGLLDENAGLAAHWRPTTLKSVEDAYGRWLTFLRLNDWLDPDASPEDRMSEDRLRAFVGELQATVAPTTLRNRMRDLAEALRVMAPGSSFPYLQRARNRSKARARPVRIKRTQMVPSSDLLQLGLKLIHEAEHGEFARQVWRAAHYRDGLMIMMLTCRPLRRQNFARLELDQHVLKRDEVYGIVLAGSETKNGRPYEQQLPAELTPFIDRYLGLYRPLLLGGADDRHLWINARGRPLPDTGVYASVTTRTKVAFGFAIPPHRFRDCAVTSLGETDPKLAWLAPALLHHADARTAGMYYDQARDTEAVKLWQAHVRTARRAAQVPLTLARP